METYTDCLTVKKEEFLALLDNDIEKLKAKLVNAKKYHETTVSEIEQIQAEIKDNFDTLMKKQLGKMAGSENEKPLELRKFAIAKEVEQPNFESVTIEQLKVLDKPPKLQQFNCYFSYMTKIELSFTNGLETAAYETTSYSSDNEKSEQTLDISKKIKKISIRVDNYSDIRGIQFLDEKNNEIAKWEGYDEGTWQPAKEIPDGFEIIGIYGDTTKGSAK